MARIIRSNIVLHPWQADIVKGVMKYPHDIHVCVAQRQRGKSVVAEQIVLFFALNNQRSTSIYVSPSFAQCEKVYTEIYNAVKDSSVFRKANGGLFKLEFVNGSSIQFLAASQDISHLQGYSVRGGILLLDEAAFLPDEVIFAMLPFVDANRAPILMISTPQFKQGYFYECFTDDTCHHYDWTTYDTTCMLSAERLEQYRKNLPKIKFTQYYLGQFVDTNSGVFGDYAELLQPRKPYTGSEQTCFGIDWGTGQGGDDTAISIWNKDTKEMMDIIYFNDRNATETVDYIVKLAKQYNPKTIVVETNSIGEVYRSMLKERLAQAGSKALLNGFVTTNASKEKLVDNYCVAIQNKSIRLVNDEKMKNEMNNFIAKPLSSGKVQYCNAKDSIHDDTIVASMLGFYAITHSGSYSIR